MKHCSAVSFASKRDGGRRHVFQLWACAVLLVSTLGLSTAARAEEWIELKAPHFTIWSEASQTKTHAWAVEFELFRRGMAQLIPIDERYVSPATVILFRSDRRIRPFMPLDHGQPAKVSGYASRREGHTLIAVSLEGARDDIRDIVYSTGLHWHLSGAERSLPDWLELGLGEVFTTFVLHGSSCDIGANRQDLYRYVRVAGSLPFADIVPLEAADLGYSEQGIDHTRRILAQCWVMTEALLFTKEGIGWNAFRKYVAQPPTGGTPSEELEHAFGLNAASLDQRLAAYLDRGKPERVTATFDRAGIDAGFTVRTLAAWEEDLVLGSLLTSTRRLDEAEGHLARAFLTAPNDPRVHEARALLALSKDDYAEAGREAQGALQAGNETFFNHYVAAYSAIQDGTNANGSADATPEIVNHLVASLELNPRFEPAYSLLGRAASDLTSAQTKAGDLLLAGAARYGGAFYVQTGSALVAARRGDSEAAHRYLATAKALAGKPDSKRAKYAAQVERIVTDELNPMTSGLALLRRLSDAPIVRSTTTSLADTPPETLREIVAALDGAIGREPHANLYYLRAAMKLQLQDYDGAIADAAEASRLAPSLVEPHLVAGEANFAKLKFAGAIAEFDAALTAQPDNAPVYARRGYMRFRSGDIKAALADLDRAIELSPHTAMNYNDRGYMRRTKGDEDGALSDFNRAIELDPNLARAYFNRAAVRGAKGDRQGAADDFGRAAAINAQAK